MHCMVFRESVEPAFCVTFETDITNFRRKVKAQNLSFTLAFVYAVCKCADEVEAFRYRFLEGKVVLFEHIDTAFTYLNQDTGLFKVVNVPLRGSIQEYVETAGRIAREQKEYFTSIHKGLKMLRWHFSVLFSWISFAFERVFAEVIDMDVNSLYNSY